LGALYKQWIRSMDPFATSPERQHQSVKQKLNESLRATTNIIRRRCDVLFFWRHDTSIKTYPYTLVKVFQEFLPTGFIPVRSTR